MASPARTRPGAPSRRTPPPRPAGRARHRRSFRAALVVALLLATLAAAGWWMLLRDAGGDDTGFVATERVFAATARGITANAEHVNRSGDLTAFTRGSILVLAQLDAKLEIFKRFARQESGQARSIAQQAVLVGQEAIDAVKAYGHAVVATKNLAAAQGAQQQVGAAIASLDQLAQQWTRL